MLELWVEIKEADYTIRFFNYPDRTDPIEDVLDVFIHFADGSRYVGSFFTLKKIEALMNEDQATGEYNQGNYFWTSDLIIVRTLTPENIQAAIKDLIQSRRFEAAFALIEKDAD